MEWEFLDRELCILTPKFLPNPPRKSSKTERHGVRKEGEDKTSPFFVQYVTYPPNPLSVKGACRFAPLNLVTTLKKVGSKEERSD
jgi:hypothetical protein